MRKDILLFDLDGTLTDPKAGITRSVAFALDKAGIHVERLDDLCSFIGPPLKDMFMEQYHFNETQALQAIEDYRIYFRRQGMLENEAYPGIIELLADLREKGNTLLVATSKPEEFATKIMKHFQLDSYMLDICGATMDGSRSEKGDVIAYAVEKHQLPTERCVMIGDRRHDIIGAKKNGMLAIGVLYGYGSRKELQEAGADIIVENIQELHKVFDKGGFYG
ncbi:HAD family hydrolase [[Clostridium] innocuum]|nr:HAD family hydrolase [[Clostridium] innocuum]